MTEQAVDFDAIVRADLAIEIMNQGRSLLSARLHDIDDGDPVETERLRSRRRDLLALQHGVVVGMPETVEPLIAEWGPRVRDEERFWREL
ncbi:hypothetical protein [Aureimonas sp. Leaf427]|uniref:hypothetical protein n=1 Tax=Aureimonas sp. Leaf427 TaxID=1736375 RepID=UPI0006F23CFE|nr:hypothetical protein [Aureimonas sp. Leaf427]KQT63302.1 hypothetical protein ASG62_22505 [Aureimonas sp. Leaf427]KQT80118.1 hypothetical protein ASG54_08260 [Aureimonas sp. Leaf460]